LANQARIVSVGNHLVNRVLRMKMEFGQEESTEDVFGVKEKKQIRKVVKSQIGLFRDKDLYALVSPG
jgi:hypothetical protein